MTNGIPADEARALLEILALNGATSAESIVNICNRDTYVSKLLLISRSHLGQVCLTAYNYSYTEMMENVNIIKADAFILGRLYSRYHAKEVRHG
uniref:Ankyrin repeat protein n=1 Tax=Steinernema glaseri TaxID=37863 RepID=A0A1I7YD01_9BILA